MLPQRISLALPAMALCLTALLAGLELLWLREKTYYLGMILWWASLPLALLLWGSADFAGRIAYRSVVGKSAKALAEERARSAARIKAGEDAKEVEREARQREREESSGIRWSNLVMLLAPVVLPTGYLWASDIYAMRRKTWHITVSGPSAALHFLLGRSFAEAGCSHATLLAPTNKRLKP